MARRKIMYRKKSQNRFSMFLAVFVMLVILAVISVRSIYLSGRLAEYDAKKQELQTQNEEENRRTEQIEDYAKYTQTNEFVEEYARDKLGLVKDDEIIFKDGGSD